MDLTITEYTPQDLDAAIQLNRSITEEWYHYFQEKDVVNLEDIFYKLLSSDDNLTLKL